MIPHDIRVFPDGQAIAQTAANIILQTAQQAVARSGVFSLVLSGGSTPKLLHQLLAGEPLISQMPWRNTEIYFGDERCVTPDHADSNYRMAHETLLSKVPIVPDNIHRMKGEIDPNEAAKEYGLLLRKRFGSMEHFRAGQYDKQPPGPDIVLLGMGDDGHTASLFPHTPAVEEREHRCIAQFVEKSTTGKSWRITLTAPFINTASLVLPLITGANKSARLHEVIAGERDPKRLPMQLIEPKPGKIIWLIDQSASGALRAAGLCG